MIAPALNALACIGVVLILLPSSYPLMAFVRSRIKRPISIDGSRPLPPVSVILVGHNEAAHARKRIEGILADPDLMPGSELIVVTGGPTDGMDQELQHFSNDPRVVLMIEQHRVTKIAGLVKAVARARNEMLCFFDWRQRIEPGSMGKLIRCAQNDAVGVATARLIDDDECGRRSWTRRLISAVNRWDSRDGGCMNIHGACYAQKRRHFTPTPDDLLFDDLHTVAAMHARGAHVVQVDEAMMHDLHFDRYYRRERILRLTRGLLLLLTNHQALLGHMPRRRALRFLHAKYAKLLLPFGIVLVLPALFIGLLRLMNHGAWLHLCLAFLLILLSLRALRFCWHMLVGVVRFFLLNDRSNEWEKLNGPR